MMIMKYNTFEFFLKKERNHVYKAMREIYRQKQRENRREWSCFTEKYQLYM